MMIEVCGFRVCFGLPDTQIYTSAKGLNDHTPPERRR